MKLFSSRKKLFHNFCLGGRNNFHTCKLSSFIISGRIDGKILVQQALDVRFSVSKLTLNYYILLNNLNFNHSTDLYSDEIKCNTVLLETESQRSKMETRTSSLRLFNYQSLVWHFLIKFP